MKSCRNCKTPKPLGDFKKFIWVKFNGNRKRVRQVTISQNCNQCRPAIRAKANMARRSKHLKSNFGISIEKYNELLAKQNGVCAICENPTSKNLAVDHCHQTGMIRGLLCQKCNMALGLLNDIPILFIKAFDYLVDSRAKFYELH